MPAKQRCPSPIKQGSFNTELCTHLTSLLGPVHHVNGHSIASHRNIQCHVAVFPHYFMDQHQVGTLPLCHPFTSSRTRRKCQAGIKLAKKTLKIHQACLYICSSISTLPTSDCSLLLSKANKCHMACLVAQCA